MEPNTLSLTEAFQAQSKLQQEVGWLSDTIRTAPIGLRDKLTLILEERTQILDSLTQSITMLSVSIPSELTNLI